MGCIESKKGFFDTGVYNIIHHQNHCTILTNNYVFHNKLILEKSLDNFPEIYEKLCDENIICYRIYYKYSYYCDDTINGYVHIYDLEESPTYFLVSKYVRVLSKFNDNHTKYIIFEKYENVLIEMKNPEFKEGLIYEIQYKSCSDGKSYYIVSSKLSSEKNILFEENDL